MPWTNVPKALWPKMEKCVEAVKASGKDERSANAICYTQVVGKGVSEEASRRRGGKR